MVFDPYGYDLNRPAQQPVDARADAALVGVPQDARNLFWRGLRDAAEGALDVWERTPPGVQREPRVFTVQHAGQPRFKEADLRYLTLDDWHRLTGLELCLTAEVVEALLQENQPVHREMLAEQCERVGQLYREMERRANEWVAQALLKWELHLLRYRASPAVAALIYG
jgi:hypothetical protein